VHNGDLSSSIIFSTMSFGTCLMFMSVLCICVYAFTFYHVPVFGICKTHLETLKGVFELRCEFSCLGFFKHFSTDMPAGLVGNALENRQALCHFALRHVKLPHLAFAADPIAWCVCHMRAL